MGSGINITLDAETRAYTQKMKAADREAKKIAKTHRDAKKNWASQVPVIGDILGGMTRMNALAAAGSLAVAGIAKAWKDVEAARKKAAETSIGGLASDQRLAQIARSPQELVSLKNQARDFATSTGVDLNAAKEVVFSLGSAGDLGSLDAFKPAALIESDISGLVNSVQTSKGAFGSTTSQSLNRLFAASRQSKFGVSELAQGAATAGNIVAKTGTTESQFLALLGSEFGTKSAEVTATGLKGLANEVTSKSGLRQFRGGNLIETVQNIQQFMQSRGIAEKDLATILGSQEAQQGFLTVSKALASGTLQANIEGIENSQGLTGELAGNLDTQARAAIQLKKARVRNQIANESGGIEESIQLAQIESAKAAAANSGFITRGAVEIESKIVDDFGVGGLDFADILLRKFGLGNRTGNFDIAPLEKQMGRTARAVESLNQRDDNRPARGAKEE